VTDFVARRRLNRSEELAAKGWYHSIEFPDGTVTDGLNSLERLKTRVAQMPIPEDLRGKRVLDIGAWDGWFSFEMERRGADVVAVDCVEIENFLYAHEARKSKVDYRILDMMELDPRELGYFDIVLFLGVVYHLKHPLLGLEKVCTLTRELAIVESHVNEDPDAVPGYPRLEFYEHDELGDRLDNWFGPSVECLLALCRTAGFARVELRDASDDRGMVACYRKWTAEPSGTYPVLVLNGVHHNRNYGFNFYTNRDEYVSCWFTPPDGVPSRDTVYTEVSGFGVQPIDVRKFDEQQWVATFKLPPGLEPGWHEVRLRTQGSTFSPPARIAVDMKPVCVGRLNIETICDGLTWARNEVSSGFVSLWITGLHDSADLGNVRVLIDGRSQVTLYVSGPDENAARQVNARLRSFVRPGPHSVVVEFGSARSQPVPLLLPLPEQHAQQEESNH